LTDPDLELVETCQKSDGTEFERAFAQIFALYQDRVYTICLRVCGNQDDALDAAQETLVTLARRIHDFKFRSRFSSWVYRIAVNSSIDVRRRRLDAPRGGVQTRLGDDSGWMAESACEQLGSDPVAEAERGEVQEQVRFALSNINPRFSSLLILRYVEGLSYEQIAETLECNLGTVKSRLNRAHSALREYMERRGGLTRP
jgi:RNA polymerase sigma-70 factor, ECF subfamily